MPTYQYACTACDHRFDAVQSFTEDSLTVCPECSGRLRKVFSAVGVVFKGSGFYRTDSRAPEAANGSSGKDAAGDKIGPKDPAVKDSGSKDSGAKDSGSRDSGSKNFGSREPARTGSGSKDSGARDPRRNGSGSKDSGSRDSGSKDSGAKSGSAVSRGASSSTGSGSAA